MGKDRKKVPYVLGGNNMTWKKVVKTVTVHGRKGYHRKGYHRKGYTRKDGTRVKATRVKPTHVKGTKKTWKMKVKGWKKV